MSTSSLPSLIKMHQAVLEKKLKMWKVYGRTDGRRTDEERCAMTIAHSSLRLRWAKNRKYFSELQTRAAIFDDGSAQKHKIGRGCWRLASNQVSSKSFSGCEKSIKMFQPIRGQGGYLDWRIGTKNINFVEDVEDLLPVKFHQNTFRGCGEVEKRFSGYLWSLRKALSIFLPSSFVKIHSVIAERPSVTYFCQLKNNNTCRAPWALRAYLVSTKYIRQTDDDRRTDEAIWHH